MLLPGSYRICLFVLFVGVSANGFIQTAYGEQFKEFDLRPSENKFQLKGSQQSKPKTKDGRFEMTLPAPQWAKDRQGCVDGLPAKKAIRICSKIIAAGKADALMYKVRGNGYYALKELNKAKADYAEAIKRAPDWESGYYNEAVVYYVFKDYERALWDLRTVLHLNPKKAKAYTKRGHIYYNIHRNDEAAQEYETALKYDPNNKVAKEWLKYSRINIEKIKGQPSYQFITSKAGSLVSAGKHKDAIALYTEAIDAMRKNGQVPARNLILERYIIDRSRARFAIGDGDTATKEMFDLVREYPSSLALGSDVALQAARHKLAREPDNAAVLDMLGQALEYSSKKQEALPTYNKVLKLARNNYEKAIALIDRANALGGSLEAMNDFNEAIRLAPSRSAYSSRAFEYSNRKNYEAAAADFTAALSLTEKNSRYHSLYLHQRARAYEKAKKFEESLRDYDALLSASPQDAQAKRERIAVLAKAGKLSEARDAINAMKKSDSKEFKKLLPELKKIPALNEYYQPDAWDTGQAVFWCRGPKGVSGEKSVSACTHLIELGAVNPDGSQDKETMAEIYFYRGVALGKIKKFKLANADFDKAVSLAPGKGEYYYYRATTWAMLGKLEKAGKDSKKACSLNKKFCKK